MPAHDILVAGWDHVEGGWVIECVCGEAAGPYQLMEQTGADFDDHLRSVGVLQESG